MLGFGLNGTKLKKQQVLNPTLEAPLSAEPQTSAASKLRNAVWAFKLRRRFNIRASRHRLPSKTFQFRAYRV